MKAVAQLQIRFSYFERPKWQGQVSESSVVVKELESAFRFNGLAVLCIVCQKNFSFRVFIEMFELFTHLSNKAHLQFLQNFQEDCNILSKEVGVCQCRLLHCKFVDDCLVSSQIFRGQPWGAWLSINYVIETFQKYLSKVFSKVLKDTCVDSFHLDTKCASIVKFLTLT